MRTALVTIQALTFVGLAALLLATGDARLGAAQALLAAVTVIVYV